MEVERNMEKPKGKEKRRRLELSNRQGFVLILIASVLIAFLVILEAPYNRLYLLNQCVTSPSLLFLNYIPVFLFMLILFSLTNRSVFTVVFSSGFFLLLGGINRYKMVLRQDPLIPGDFTLISELIDTLRNFNTTFILLIFLGAAVFLALMVLSLRFFRDRKKRPVLRIATLVLCFVAIFVVNMTLYADSKRYDNYTTKGYSVFKVREYSSKGFIYSFLVDYNEMKVEAPEGYDAAVYKALDEAVAATVSDDGTEVQPHIIMIMGETFADLEISSHFSFDGYDDPMSNYRQLAADSYLSGSIVVPLFGGGTAYTEYEALTGAPAAVIDNSISPYRYIRKNIRSLPRILDENGYATLAIHPGRAWFYNRSNVYPYMGFDEALFVDDAFDENTQKYGGYISEEATIDVLIDRFDEHLLSSTDPLFLFCVTIQNHGPYAEKYGAETNFSSDLSFTAEESDELSNYFYGLSTVDDELGRLVEYLQGLSEPVILVYFGDHLPGFTEGATIYEKLDMGVYADESSEQMLLGYETPFCIWQNDAAEESGVLADTAVEPSSSITMNAYYLCSTLYTLLDYTGQDAYLDRLYELGLELPVVTDYTFVDGEGDYISAITDEQEEEIQFLNGWTYYKMFDEKVTAGQ